jgi:hypothetical protein
MDLGQTIVIVLSVFMGVWYLVGSIFNRRRGVDTYRWLRDGLQHYGKISEAKWIGSSASGARMVIDKPEAPFRRIETIFLMNSREILPLWLFNLLRGKTDELVLKANLRKTPAYQMEIAHQGKLNMEKIKEQAGTASLQRDQLAGFEIVSWGKPRSETGQIPETLLAHYSQELINLSLRRSSPHLIVKIKLPNPKTAPKQTFLEPLAGWLNGETPDVAPEDVQSDQQDIEREI